MNDALIGEDLLLLLTDDRSGKLTAEALSQIAAKQGRKAKDVAPALGKGVRTRLHARLAERGLLHEESAKILGIFPSHRWPSSDSRREDSVRALLAEALRTGATDDAHIAGASSRSSTRSRRTPKSAIPAEIGITKEEMNTNAKRIAEGDWASEAVSKAIDAMLAATIAATSSSAVIASGGA